MKTSNRLILIIGLLIILAAAFLLFNQKAAAPKAGTSAGVSQVQADGYQGIRTTSSDKSYSFVVPAGTAAFVCRDSNLIFAGSIQYEKSKPATATRSDCGKDGPLPFTAFYENKTNYTVPEGDVSPYGTVDGISGQRYVKVYAAGEPLGITTASAGDTLICYEFKASNGYYQVQYFKSAANASAQPLVEQVVRSFRFNDK